MTPEEATKVRALLGTPEKPWDGPDDGLLDAVASFVGDADAAATTATTDLQAARVSMSQLQTERDDARQKAQEADERAAAAEGEVRVSMSQNQPAAVPDAVVAMMAEAYETDAAQLVDAGVMSPAEWTATKALFYEGNRPGVVAMSMTPGSSQTRLKQLLAIRKAHAGQGIAVGMSMNRGPTAPLPTGGEPKDQARQLTEPEYHHAMSQAGHTTGHDDYVRYQSARAAR